MPLNLAEGYGRISKADQKRFFKIALGSARECQAPLQLANLEHTTAVTLLDQTAESLYNLIKKG